MKEENGDEEKDKKNGWKYVKEKNYHTEMEGKGKKICLLRRKEAVKNKAINERKKENGKLKGKKVGRRKEKKERRKRKLPFEGEEE